MSLKPRLTPKQIVEIHRLRMAGFKLREIAADLGVSVNSASRHGRQLVRPRRRITTVRQMSDSFIRPPTLAQLMAGR
jgi:FixJ family two-component response regulator